MTIGIDLGDVWSHYCTLNQEGEVVDQGRFRTTLAGVERWFNDLPPVRIAMEAGTHSISISQQLQEMGHKVIVANVRELRAISHSDRKSDQVEAGSLCKTRPKDPSADRSSDRCAARSTHSGPSSQFDRPPTNGGGERSARAS
jgi:transposase